jgi:hypothetical protein
LARAAWGGFLRAAGEILDAGAFQPFEPIAPFRHLNAAFRARNSARHSNRATDASATVL